MLWVNLAFFTVISVIACILIYVQCEPPRALWEKVEGAKCWDPDVEINYSIFVSSYSAFADFFLALMPITIMYDLQMSLTRRVGLSVLLGLGVL